MRGEKEGRKEGKKKGGRGEGGRERTIERILTLKGIFYTKTYYYFNLV